MRTEKEIRERLEDIEDVLKIMFKLNHHDSAFIAFHTVLEWVLQDSEVSET